MEKMGRSNSISIISNNMELITIRKHLKPTHTIGHFYIEGGIYFCDTLEDPVRNLVDINKDGDFDDFGEGKIYGNTAIPAGRYKVIISYSPNFKRYLPMLIGVYGFVGIRIHNGSTVDDTHGCLLVGKNTFVGGLSSSRNTLNSLMYYLIENNVEKDIHLRPIIIKDEAYGSMYKLKRPMYITIKNS